MNDENLEIIELCQRLKAIIKTISDRDDKHIQIEIWSTLSSSHISIHEDKYLNEDDEDDDNDEEDEKDEEDRYIYEPN